MNSISEKNSRILGAVLGIVVVVVATLGFYIFLPHQPMQEGVVYKLAKTEKIWIDLGNGQVEPGRLFLFADRNDADKSLPVPLLDPNGIPLIRVNTEMEPGTVRIVRIQVPERTIEGVTYPGYTFKRWEFNWSVVEEQKFIPTLKPRT